MYCIYCISKSRVRAVIKRIIEHVLGAGNWAAPLWTERRAERKSRPLTVWPAVNEIVKANILFAASLGAYQIVSLRSFAARLVGRTAPPLTTSVDTFRARVVYI
mmetsp:Transcript_13049/g.24498  ORF Transcript_13049/g.24498 Transcript_13049/m.24498 type:complete len:104 (-) Transcript_13049:708-1019(-)